MKKYWNILFAALFAFAVLAPVSAQAQTVSTPRGIIEIETEQTGVSDGTYHVYIDLRYYKRTDIRVTQDGGSGSIVLQVYASWDPGGGFFVPETGLDYDDIGESIYQNTGGEFSDATENLRDTGGELLNASWLRLTFTVAGAAADASYKVIKAQIPPEV